MAKAIPTRGRPKKTPKTTLKEVVIPPASFNASSRSVKRASSSRSPETSGSGLSSLGDQFSDNETPETSAIMTPAESLTKREPSSKIFNTTLEGDDDTSFTNTEVSVKRKRAHVDDDALLAQTLQEEEYQRDGSGQSFVKRQRTIKSKNSLDLPSLSNRIEALLPEQERRTHSKSLRTRRARESDGNTLEPEDAREVMDTNSDDSELSEYNAREDLDDPAESDSSEDNSSASEPLASINSRSRSLHRGSGTGRTSSQHVSLREQLQRRQRMLRQRQRQGAPIPAVESRAAESWRSRRLSRVS